MLVEGLELTFDLPGMPYLEPRFANCRFAAGRSDSISFEKDGEKWKEEKSNAEKSQERSVDPVVLNGPWTGKGALIGVIYLVSPKDFARVIATEGGGSAYKLVAVEGRVLAPETRVQDDKHYRSMSSMEVTGEVVRAYTLLAPASRTRQTPGEPSSRYLSLIKEGAEGKSESTFLDPTLTYDSFFSHYCIHPESSLPATYQSYLASLTPYSPKSLRQKLGRVLIVSTWIPVIAVLVILGIVLADADGHFPAWINSSQETLSRAMWDNYDKVWLKRFGDGERSEKGSDNTHWFA